ncbi:hypothetical protein ACTQ4E_03025 [Lawsonibacter sp. LCP25S3_G6]|uniref:hypothetical protein n=1 Tax=unclassified Lawsonibacter TaxID=2617946 RepID=UPI003F95B699
MKKKFRLCCGVMLLGCLLMLAGFLTDRSLLYIPGILTFFAGILLEFMLIRCPFCHRYVALYVPGKFCPHCGGEMK